MAKPDQSQLDKFKEVARDLSADERLEKLVKYKPVPGKKD
jgi:hypothetical protein